MNFRTHIVIAILTVMMAACSKQVLMQTSKTGSHNQESASVTGTWQWVQSNGGFAYHVETPASAGKQLNLNLTDSTYTYYLNNTVSLQGTYHTELRTCIHDHTQKPFLNFSGAQGLMIESQHSDTLFLSDENYDGMGSIYTRKATGIQ